MYVSKDQNVAADFYMESDAEEIYMPESGYRNPGGRGFTSNRISTTTEDETGIVGYQKYLHIVNRLALDNTNSIEPHQPELSHFLRINEQEEQEHANLMQKNQQAMTQTGSPGIGRAN